MQARRASEQQVATEIRRLEQQLSVLHEKAARIDGKIILHDPAQRSVNKDAFHQHLSQMEKRWEEEFNDVKRELHQTILAHNHNADLMADHKATLDRYRTELNERSSAMQQDEALRHTAESDELIRGQLRKVDEALDRERGEETELGSLQRRIETLTGQLYGSWGATVPPLWSGPPTAPYGPGPGMSAGGYPGMPM